MWSCDAYPKKGDGETTMMSLKCLEKLEKLDLTGLLGLRQSRRHVRRLGYLVSDKEANAKAAAVR